MVLAQTTLITGGGGFIGAHVAEELLRAGDHVRALDSLVPQVHGDANRPDYLSDDVELIVGDVRDGDVVRKALVGVDRVVHFAARVGVGQSMYEIAEYTSVNAVGTGVLLEALLDSPVDRLVVASSMSVYGEGLYLDDEGTAVTALARRREDLQNGQWEPRGPRGQALSNPYTGVLAIFASRLLNDRPPLIFEDGEQRRDFVSVHDVARACRLALTVRDAAGRVINVGSGQSVSVNEIAQRLGKILGKEQIEPEVTGKYRVGDIRHCFADISLANDVLNFTPKVDMDSGLTELAEWLEGQVAVDSVDAATSELASRGLTV